MAHFYFGADTKPEPTILEALPDAKLNAAQEAAAPLGGELSFSDRYKTVEAFVKAIKDGIDVNEEKIKAAKNAAAPPTPVPGESN